jgi:hypothetical protein
MFQSNVITIEEVLVRTEVLNTKFECDLQKCKGACCTMESEYGAPLSFDEIGKIGDILDTVKEYLSERNQKEIDVNGFYNVIHNEPMTSSIDNKDCVFVYYEGNIAKCAIEKAYNDGKVDFKKPISCHLFPIRISHFGNDVLRYEKFSECGPALEKGKNSNITIAEFCEDSLTRLYGKNWYSSLKENIG